MKADELPTVRLVHTADIHLDGQAARMASFEAVIDITLEKEVDALLIAGDLFDSARVSDETISQAIDQLKRLRCPVVIVPGNHDCLDQKSLHDRINFDLAGPQVHFCSEREGSWVKFDNIKLAVWGHGIDQHTPDFRPLLGYRPVHAEYWRVIVTHGFYVPADGKTDRSSPIGASEIDALECDYLALGHWHYFLDISAADVRAYYPGSPGECNNNDYASVNLVELDAEHGVSVERVAIHGDFVVPTWY